MIEWCPECGSKDCDCGIALTEDNERLRQRVKDLESDLDNCGDDLAQARRYIDTLKDENEGEPL